MLITKVVFVKKSLYVGERFNDHAFGDKAFICGQITQMQKLFLGNNIILLFKKYITAALRECLHHAEGCPDTWNWKYQKKRQQSVFHLKEYTLEVTVSNLT